MSDEFLKLDINKKVRPFSKDTALVRRFYAAAAFYFANGRTSQAKADAMYAYELANVERIKDLRASRSNLNHLNKKGV